MKTYTEQVGIFEDAGNHPNADMSVAELAAIHEFGIGVPERSFIRNWVDENTDEIYSRLEQAIDRALGLWGSIDEAQLEIELDLIGEWMEEEIKIGLMDGVPPPLAESTKQKGRVDPPLIDTGTILQSIIHRKG